jgi:hypothetical protein
MTQRQCAPCRACCITPSSAELAKPQNVACQHLCPSGCSIYGLPQKPQTCSDFQCEWLRGNLPADCRPDQLGVMFWFGKPMLKPNGTLVSTVLLIGEVQPGALAANRLQIDTLARQLVARRLPPGHQKFAIVERPYDTPGTGLPGDGYEDQLEWVDGKYILHRVPYHESLSNEPLQHQSPVSLAQICGPSIIVTPGASPTA